MNPLLEPWANFNLAVAGASAALAGLIIVAVSVNLDRIITASAIVARTGAAIGALALTVASACLALVPDQSLRLYGVEVLVGALVPLWLGLIAARRIYQVAHAPADPRVPRPPRMWPPAKIALSLVAPILFLVSGALLATERTAGLNWLAAASLTAIVVGVTLSWIVLIEVRR